MSVSHGKGSLLHVSTYLCVCVCLIIIMLSTSVYFCSNYYYIIIYYYYFNYYYHYHSYCCCFTLLVHYLQFPLGPTWCYFHTDGVDETLLGTSLQFREYKGRHPVRQSDKKWLYYEICPMEVNLVIISNSFFTF